MAGWRFLSIFRIVLVVLLAVVQYFFYSSIKNYVASAKKPKWMRVTVNVLFAVFNLPMIIFLSWRPNIGELSPWFMDFGVYPYYVWHYSFVFLFLLIAIGKIIQLPFLSVAWLLEKIFKPEQTISKEIIVSSTQTFDSTRRKFVRRGITALGGALVASNTFGIIRRDKYEISNVSIPIENLPREFDGFTIALASDIHSSIFMTKERMQDYAAILNSLNADTIAVTGDFVNSLLEEVYPFAEAFSSLKAPSGVYGVLGNHDYFTRNVEMVAKEVNDCGIRLLRNDKVLIEKNNAKLCLLGVDDVGNSRRASSQINQAMSGIEEQIPKILMCHRPYFFQQAAEHNINLTLSGHTHGGQIVFVKIGNDIIAPARMVSPYVAGLYSIGSSHMYVSRGIGTVGVPIRINCPPEVTKITFVKA